MKKIFYLVFTLLMISTLSAQNKKLTLYYPDSTRVVNIAGLDSMVIFICGASKVSYGGKDYNTVLIGDQCWLRENLDIGTMINSSTNQSINDALEKFCYDNNPVNCTNYGGLYQWDEAMQYVTTEIAQGICPDGWHIPTNTEFQTLAATVANDGKALKEIGQGNGTNLSGFSALLSGGYSITLNFIQMGEVGYFWSSTSTADELWADYMHLYAFTEVVHFSGDIKADAMSIRCIKNN